MPKKRSSLRIKKRRNISWEKIVFFIIVALFILFSPGQNIYFLEKSTQKEAILRPFPFEIPSPAPYPKNISGIYPGAEYSANGIVVLDMDSGVYLFKRNAEELLAPASITKIMTALIAVETYGLEDIVTVRTLMHDGQTMGLVAGEKITIENLLLGALIHSGNDAAYALADYYPGGVEKFIEAMNKKATALHLDNTHFTNPVGFDDPGHRTTPMDLSRLASVALSNKIIAKMVAIPQITISDVTHTYFHSLKNVNDLLGKIPGVGGIKTGWTEEAGENLVTLVERNGHRVIIVLLKSKDRFGETSRLIDWIYSCYRWEQIIPTMP